MLRDPIIQMGIWEHDEYVITIDGRPIGHSMSPSNAQFVRDWLISAIDEIHKHRDRAVIEEAKQYLHDHKHDIVVGREDRSLTDIIEDAAHALDAMLEEE